MVPRSVVKRTPGEGWLVLIGGGEFSFAETDEADDAWLAKAEAGPVGFLPTASGSVDYGRHFSEYLEEHFERQVEVIPVYRPRDARRGKNRDRVRECPAVYLGGGVPDTLLETLYESPVAEALAKKLLLGGVVVAIAGAAQVAGQLARSLRGRGELIPGLGWLRGGVVEPNFDPDHDRRLRRMLESPAVEWGLGIPAGCAVLLGPGEAVEVVGEAWVLTEAGGELEELEPV